MMNDDCTLLNAIRQTTEMGTDGIDAVLPYTSGEFRQALKQQRTEGKRSFARKQRTRPLAEQLDIPAHAGIEVNRHGALGNLHGKRGVGKLGRLFRDDQKYGNVPRAGFTERLRGKGQKAHGFRRRGGHGNRLRRNGNKGRHRRNAHADSSSGFR